MNSWKLDIGHWKLKRGFTLKRELVNFKHGFTLIELLIVITIIGTLAGLAVASYGTAQEKGRDSRRKSDVDNISKALELSKQDSPGSYTYPQTLGSIAPNYIQQVPKDPRSNSSYIYLPTTDVGGACTNNCVTYSLVACLENASDNQKDAAKYSGCSTASYTVTPN